MLRRARFVSLVSLACFFVHSIAAADERLPAYLIRLPESVTTVFVAETAAAEFHRFNRVGDGIEYRDTRYMSIGRGGEGKQRAGDRRTPLGVYFVTEELDTRHLHERYGITAFPLDYPNVWDLRRRRGGDGIWIHGVDPAGGKRPPRDTDGCIALANDDLSELVAEFRANTTPVVIAREIEWLDMERLSLLRNELENAIAQWTAAVASGDMHRYLSLYDDDFERWGMQRSEWLSFSMETLGTRALRDVSSSDLLLLGDPEEDGVYLSRFKLAVDDGSMRIASTKRLYWRRDDGGALKIVAEDSG